MTSKKQIDSKDLEDMASQLEHWASRYRELSAMLSDGGVDSVGVTGMATFARIVNHLGSNTRRIRVQIQKEIDERRGDNRGLG